MAEFETCSICYEYQSLFEGDCCGQHLCEICLKKWLEKQDTCPFCRITTQEEKWIDIGNNIGYKISIICDTLKSCNVHWVSIEKEEFESLEPYFKDYVSIRRETEVNNRCFCSTDYSVWYGMRKRVIIDLNLHTYYEYYMCSRCADWKPSQVWNRMLKGKKNISFEPNLAALRDELIDAMKHGRGDWKAIEQILLRYYLRDRAYLNLKEYKFIVNLLIVCSGNVYIHSSPLFNFMLKYVDIPTKKWHSNWFMKIFFDEAWKGSMKCKGFLGLYPIISLWNIIRDPEENFAKRSETYEDAFAYKREWLEEMEIPD